MTELAYLAGFIDGEGSINISKGRWKKMQRGYALGLTVKQVDPRPLQLLAARFGGKVFRVVPTQPRRLVHHRWGIAANQAERAIRALRPHLIVKADQADLALGFRALRYTPGKALSEWDYAERDAYVEAMREAHHLEIEIAA